MHELTEFTLIVRLFVDEMNQARRVKKNNGEKNEVIKQRMKLSQIDLATEKKYQDSLI